jgi:hypothetical protein
VAVVDQAVCGVVCRRVLLTMVSVWFMT